MGRKYYLQFLITFTVERIKITLIIQILPRIRINGVSSVLNIRNGKINLVSSFGVEISDECICGVHG